MTINIMVIMPDCHPGSPGSNLRPGKDKMEKDDSPQLHH